MFSRFIVSNCIFLNLNLLVFKYILKVTYFLINKYEYLLFTCTCYTSYACLRTLKILISWINDGDSLDMKQNIDTNY